MTNEKIDELVALHVRKFGFDEYRAYGKHFKPSTDLNIAFECIEAFEKNDTYIFSVATNYCYVQELKIKSEPFDFHEETTAIAICKALLKAVGVKVEE